MHTAVNGWLKYLLLDCEGSRFKTLCASKFSQIDSIYLKQGVGARFSLKFLEGESGKEEEWHSIACTNRFYNSHFQTWP